MKKCFAVVVVLLAPPSHAHDPEGLILIHDDPVELVRTYADPSSVTGKPELRIVWIETRYGETKTIFDRTETYNSKRSRNVFGCFTNKFMTTDEWYYLDETRTYVRSHKTKDSSDPDDLYTLQYADEGERLAHLMACENVFEEVEPAPALDEDLRRYKSKQAQARRMWEHYDRISAEARYSKDKETSEQRATEFFTKLMAVESELAALEKIVLEKGLIDPPAAE